MTQPDQSGTSATGCYACVVAIHHLKMKVGKNAVAEFRTRLSDIEQATEDMLRRVQGGTEGRRNPNERVIVPLSGAKQRFADWYTAVIGVGGSYRQSPDGQRGR